VKVTTMSAPFGCFVMNDGETVAELRVHENKQGDRTLTLSILGDESAPDTTDEVREQLAARGFELDDLSEVEEIVNYAKAYGVCVHRHPTESAVFRMEFVSGQWRGKVVEIDVRTDGTTVTGIPDDWRPMTGILMAGDLGMIGE
jgi:hypothetical protein